MITPCKMDKTIKLYDKAPKDGKIYQMLWVYTNEAGESYVGTCCEFGLEEKGYLPTGKVVFAE